MRKILLLLFLFFYADASKIIEITYNDTNIEEFSMGYLFDDSNSLKIEDILKLDFKKTTNRASFGVQHDVAWYKIEILNSADIDKIVYLHDNFAYMSKKIAIFEFKNKKLVDQNVYNLFDGDIDKRLSGSTLIYSFILPQNSTKTIYLKNSANIHQFIDLKIYDSHNSKQALINKNFYSNILVAILLALAFYNIILFLFSKGKEFLYYALYLLNGCAGLFYMYGTIYNNFNIYGTTAYWFNITVILISTFFILFIKAIFDTHKIHNLNTVLNSVIYLSLIYMIIALFIDLNFAIKEVWFLFLYTFVVLLYTGIYFYNKKHPLAKIFLLAYIIYILGMGLTMAMFMGYFDYSFFIFHASGFGLVAEALLFSYLIYYRIELLKKEIFKHQNTLILKNKKAQMGDMIGSITHQWKQPLTAISSAVMALQYRLNEHDKVSTDYLKSKLLQINDKTEFLVETIDDFKYFFNPERTQNNIQVENIINRAVSLCDDDIMSKNITLKTDLNFTKTINIYSNELLHIILNLIQNSEDAFEKKEMESKMIKIIGVTKNDKTVIDIIDNAGGISQEVLAKIFDESYTTKEKKEGSGLGLYLSKFILEEHMQGSIEVKRVGNGTMFRITI